MLNTVLPSKSWNVKVNIYLVLNDPLPPKSWTGRANISFTSCYSILNMQLISCTNKKKKLVGKNIYENWKVFFSSNAYLISGLVECQYESLILLIEWEWKITR